ncbi:hypothetical protein J437_LFUL013386 [Ladona fulva]|uniref:Serpin domain-containing protein n=1 Tax=Ladona fulva TaxID=123851 RepID=A0A8K0KGP7_LADFU|nr:hypothetical protein J437_LFUL013386 [Ladona fulva]
MWLRTLCYSAFLFLLPGAHSPALAAATNVQRLSRAHFEFTLDLYRHLMDEPGGRENVIFSPYSITTVLSMLFLGAGANSNTSRQLREVLHYNNLSYSEVHNAFKLVLENFHDSYYNDTVRVANGVFKQAGVPVSSYYERALKEFYKTQMDVVDFEKDEGSARNAINKWVSRHTGGKITELLVRPLSSGTKLLLVNALAMRARWLLRFEESHTFAKGLFYTHAQRRCVDSGLSLLFPRFSPRSDMVPPPPSPFIHPPPPKSHSRSPACLDDLPLTSYSLCSTRPFITPSDFFSLH